MDRYKQAGRSTLLLIACILLIDALFYFIVDNSLPASSKLFRLFFSSLLMVFLYRGKAWSKWLIGFSLIINSLLCILRAFFAFPDISETMYSVLYVILYSFLGLALLTSRKVSAFMEYQRRSR